MNNSEQNTHLFSTQVYYEDTDHSGVVYHANYLKFFERAREDLIGVKTLVDMWQEYGIGFAVYKADLGFHEGAVFGDLLEIKTRWEKDGAYRLVFSHEAWRPGAKKAAVKCKLELVCLESNKKLIPIPDLEFLKTGKSNF
jgi:acyl-CoA thioester hydrolase